MLVGGVAVGGCWGCCLFGNLKVWQWLPVFLALNYWHLLQFIMAFYFELGQNWDNFYLRHKKSPSIIRKDLIMKLFDGGSCAIRTRDHRSKSAYPTTWSNLKRYFTPYIYIVSSCFNIAWIWLTIVWLVRLNLGLVFLFRI